MPLVILGSLFIAFGVVSILDAQRIGAALRSRGTLDIVGPDRYLYGVAVLLIVVGVLVIGKAWRERRSERRAGAPVAVPGSPGAAPGEAEAPQGKAHLWLFAALVAYVSMLPILGYLVATVLFAAAAFFILGMAGAWRIALASILLTGLCYGSFLMIADLPLPRGVLGI